jgi:hypothetical protein
MLIQIILSAFILLILLNLIFKNKKQHLRKTEFFLWFLFWFLGGLTIWFPNLLTQFANFLGIGRGADLIFYLSIIILFFIISKIYIKIEKIERNITKLVRKDALENHHKEQ